MIAIEKTQTVKSSGIKDSVSFGIKADGFAHIFNVLRNQLYSDKILAVVREYSCNAIDANVEAGKGATPISVSLPNRLCSTFKVRDFGNGLTDADIHDIYAFYGESTKRKSNAMIGQLGLGSKSAFAYGDNFVINSFVNGVKNTYNAFIDDSQVGQIAKLGSETTTESNGVEIVISVKDCDYDVFRQKAEGLFKHFKVQPIVKGAAVDLKKSQSILSGSFWEITAKDNNHNCALAVMGNIAYPIDFYSLKSSDNNLSKLLQTNLVVEFEIGELDISASREKLQYTDRAIKTIVAKMTTILAEMDAKVQEKLKNCETLFQAKKVYGSIFDYDSPLYCVSGLIKKVSWNKMPLLDNRIAFEHKDCSSTSSSPLAHVRGYTKSWRGVRISSNERLAVECGEKVVLILNDKGIKNGIVNRVYDLIHTKGKYPYVFSIKDKAFFAKYNLNETKDFILLSSLPARSFASSGGVSAVKSPKHSSKEFIFDATKSSWGSTRSSFWIQESVNVANDSGIYVEIENFDFKADGGFTHPHGLVSYIKNLVSLGLTAPKIYGFKKHVMEEVKKNKKFIPLSKYIKDSLENFAKTNKLSQQIANRQNYNQFKADWWNLSKFTFDPSSPITAALKKIKFCQDKVNETKLEAILAAFGYFGVVIEQVKPTYELDKVNEEILKMYSMFNLCDWYKTVDNKNSCHFIEYVDKVDAFTNFRRAVR
jgi:hypothetical protein